VASVTARAGLSEACTISYIQYIGVVSAGLPSATRGGAPPNSPIGIFFESLSCTAKYCRIHNNASMHSFVYLGYIYGRKGSKTSIVHGKVMFTRRPRAGSHGAWRC